MDAADVAALAASCPNLSRLQLDNVMQPCREALGSLVGLQQQLDLPWLSLAGACVSDDNAAVLAQMSSLKSLQLTGEKYGASPLTELGLRQLTALQQLTQLRVCGFKQCAAHTALLDYNGRLQITATGQVSSASCHMDSTLGFPELIEDTHRWVPPPQSRAGIERSLQHECVHTVAVPNGQSQS